MTDDWKPLYILSNSKPTPDQIEILKKAKKDSGLEELIKPVRAFPGCGRLLLFDGEWPPFACDWAPTTWDDPLLGAKLKWAVTGLDGRPRTVAMWLSKHLKGEVTLIREEEWEAE